MIFTNSSLPTCPLREEKSLSQRAFSIYTDIRMNNSLAKVHPELVSEWSEKNLTLAMNVNNRMYN